MNLYESRLMIAIRSVARKSGLLRFFSSLIQSGNYESSFDNAMLSRVLVGDVVWDVGANVGYYTIKFSEVVGNLGRVYAFEPFPSTVLQLEEAVFGRNNCLVLDVGLGTSDIEMSMVQGGDELGATNRVVSRVSDVDPSFGVKIFKGDSVISSGRAESPNFIKIDTEGSELDVLEGIPELLRSPSLRVVCIEVHFGILSERGDSFAPLRIVEILRDAGFVTSWVDSSHLIGERRQ